jgi:hypothetical protein
LIDIIDEVQNPSDEIVRVLASSTVDRGFDARSCQTKTTTCSSRVRQIVDSMHGRVKPRLQPVLLKYGRSWVRCTIVSNQDYNLFF